MRAAGGQRNAFAAGAWGLVGALPLIGMASLLLRSRLDPPRAHHPGHFLLFLAVGAVDFALAVAAGEAARKRGDARVLLISLAFLATGGFLALHAAGTPGILFSRDLTGFKVAIPVGLVVAALFAVASAFAEAHPGLGRGAIRHQRALQAAVVASMVIWIVYTVAELPPLDRPIDESATS